MTSNRKSPEDCDSSSSSDQEKLVKHWFFEHTIDAKQRWSPFTFADSMALEEAFLSHDTKKKIITTDGGRFDVDIPSK